jgi:hypothetical protein
MQIAFEHTWPLLLLPALAGLWWVRRRTIIEFHPRQLDLMLLLRGVALALVILAMSQPVLHRSGSWISVVYLLDVSHSIKPLALDHAITWVDKAVASGEADTSAFFAFGANAVEADAADGLRAVRVADGRVFGAVDRSATNLAAAIERGLAALPPYHVPRLVLLTDGHGNRGDFDRAVDRLRLDGVRTYTRATEARDRADAWIDGVEFSDTVTAGLPFALRVELFAQVATEGTLIVAQGRRVLTSETVRLAAGATIVDLRPVLEDAGSALLDVLLQIERDPEPQNNLVQMALHAVERPKLLYVEGRAETVDYLRDALMEGGFEVELGFPWDLPTDSRRLETYAAVILSDVDPRLLSVPAMNAIESYVSDYGGGLLLAGGESVYGEDGYSDTAIERAMPIWFKAEHKPQDLALVIALDKSYSMVGDKMALAKEASKAALDLLEDDQQFGLLAFDYHFYWPVPIQLASAKDRLRERIAAIEASSPTNIYPALQDVFLSLQQTEAEVKHVILLSDGKTYEDDYEGLVTEMVEDEITVSTVAVGGKADRELLSNIAKWGDGRSYFIEDPTRVPEIFVEETQKAQGITLEEDDEVRSEVRKPIEALAGLEMETAPALLGYVRTMSKDNSEVVLDTGDDGDPILVRWQYGLGRTVFFAADVKNRWSAPWLEWDGYGKFWVQLVREAMRQDAFRLPGFTVVRDQAGARVRLELVDDSGRFRNALRPTVAVTVGDDESELELAQVAPGRYQARLPLSLETEASFRWSDRGDDIERTVVPVVSEERRYRPADDEALRRLAAATGGVHDPTLDQLFDAGDQTVTRPLRLWPALAAVALLLYLANMLLRRVRVFRDEGGIIGSAAA